MLVAGDALTGDGGGVALPSEEFTPDYEEALRSVEYLGTVDYATAYFGHGEPVTSGASDEVLALAQRNSAGRRRARRVGAATACIPIRRGAH